MKINMSVLIVCVMAISFSSLPINAHAFEPFTDMETELIQKKIDDAYQEAEGKQTKEEIWDDWKKEMLESEPGKKRLSLDFSPHKLNYFIANGLPGDPAAQVKFQISAKYQVFEGSLNVFKRNYFPLYMAYTQKSFWNVGIPSAPFEENNYNPEMFLDYQVKGSGIYLDHVVIGGEHESNGRDGAESRSWNRLYLLLSFGIEAKEGLEEKGVLRKEKYSTYLKIWEAYGEEDQDDYLKSIGRNETFLDYAGRGEVGFSIRELPIISYFRVLRNNQLDFRTRIFRDWDKGSIEIGYHQNIPYTNFFLYVQYWDGYGESLQRFSSHDTKWKGGLSFFF